MIPLLPFTKYLRLSTFHKHVIARESVIYMYMQLLLMLCGTGSYQGLVATVAVDIVGLERLPKAMGWLQFPRAIAALLIIPLGGCIKIYSMFLML